LKALALADDVLCKGAFRVSAKPDFGGFEYVAPEHGIGVDDGSPRFGDTRCAEKGWEGEIAEYLRNEFWRQKGEEVACESRGENGV
jgi:hypothetical protein